MATGFQLAGFAQGMDNATKLDIAQQEQDLKRDALVDAKDRLIRTEGDKLISGTMSSLSTLLKSYAEAGKDPRTALQNGSVQSLLQSAKGLATRLGRDPADLDLQADLMALQPAASPTAKGPQTDIGKIHADVAAGHITPEEGAAKIKNLTRPLGEANTVESIRQKIAANPSKNPLDTLNPGEAKVYDDYLKADPMARLLSAAMAGTLGKPAVPANATPVPPRPDPLGFGGR